MKNIKKQALNRIVALMVFGLTVFNVAYLQNWVFIAVGFLAIPISGYLFDLFAKDGEKAF